MQTPPESGWGGADRTAQWSGPADGSSGLGGPDDGRPMHQLEDPWESSTMVDESASPRRPNWLLIIGGIVAALGLLFLAANLFGGSGDAPVATEPTLPLQSQEEGPSSTTSVTEAPPEEPGPIEAVRIELTDDPTGCLGTGSNPAALEGFLNAALSQQGTAYRFGAEADPTEAEPTAFDASELVQWAGARAGLELVDGSWLQYLALKDCGSTMSVEEALTVPGALVFHFPTEPVVDGERPPGSMVAISLGDGRLIGAFRSSQVVEVREPAGLDLSHGATIPDLGRGTAEYLP